MKHQISLILLLILCSNIVSAQTETCLQNLNHPDNRIISQVVASETINREYILYIPQNYNDNIATPLVINMHGFGDCASDYSETIGSFYDFNDLADQENFIVAYPQGAYRPEKEDTYWEPGDTGVDNIYENDIYFIEELISDIDAEFNLDLDKVYACGYSNGGMMAYSLACNRSDLFSAIGIMSGTMLAEDCDLIDPVPIIKFHGIADAVLPYDGNFWYQSVDEVVRFWLDKNSVNLGSLVSSQLNDGKVVKDEYSEEGSNGCLTLYTINEEYDKPGDHVWFSEEIEGITPNRIMWDFFKKNCGIINSLSENNETDILLFPNPFTNQITIQNARNKKYSIYDINGNLLLKDKLNINSESIDLSQLSRGIYIVKMDGQSKKLLKI